MVDVLVPPNRKDACVISHTHSGPTRPVRFAAGPRALAAAALVVVTAAGCASSGPDTSATTGSSDLASVTVTGGDAKTSPTLKIPAEPFSVTKTEVRELSKGTGAVLTDKDIVSLDIALFNGTNGDRVDSSFEGAPGAMYLGQRDLIQGLKKGLLGAKVGARLLVAVPPAEAFGSTGNSALKIGPDDTVLFVVDTIAKTPMLARATGKAVAPNKGLPTVKIAADGGATISIPAKKKAPTSLVVQPLVKGSGAKVRAGNVVRVTYTLALWRTGKKLESSLDRDPNYLDFPVGSGSVIKAWDEGLVGQRVGSRLLMVVPPSAGYGATGSPPDIKGTDTLVFVVDILGAY